MIGEMWNYLQLNTPLVLAGFLGALLGVVSNLIASYYARRRRLHQQSRGVVIQVRDRDGKQHRIDVAGFKPDELVKKVESVRESQHVRDVTL